MTDKFRTELKPSEKEYSKFSHDKPLGLIGSCFSNNIGDKLKEYRFLHISNPFGTTYNPISIANQIQRLIDEKAFVEGDLFQRNGSWNSFELHGSFLNQRADKLLSEVNKSLLLSSSTLKKSSHLFITFGTAWVYELKETGEIVNNCHKIPSIKFERRMLSVNEIVSVYQKLFKSLIAWNPEITLVFTISPVRHLKDGFEENSLSKSTLRLAVNEIAKIAPTFYFPSYEIVMDDLRDYRFYKDDLLHPTNFAVNYIWNKLCNAFLNPNSKSLLVEIEALNKAINHKAFDSDSKEHQTFIRNTIAKIDVLEKSNPKISFKEKLKKLEDRLV